MKTRSRCFSEMTAPLFVHLISVVLMSWAIAECFLDGAMVA